MRFFIVNLIFGNVQSTQNEQIAKDCANSEDFFVIDTYNNTWLDGDEIREIDQIK